MLLLHQFRDDMLPNRDQIEAPPELALVIQMDGLGTIPDKNTSWARTTAGWETDQFEYGWKNFFDEDIPGPSVRGHPPARAVDRVYLVPVNAPASA